MALLDKVKMACRVTTTAFDTELTDLISAAFADMGVTDIRPDVLTEENITPLVQRAVTTYCRMHFGQPDSKNAPAEFCYQDEYRARAGKAGQTKSVSAH